MRGVQVLVRAVLGVSIVAAGVSGAVLPAHAQPAVAPGVPTWVVTSNPSSTSIDVAWTAPASDGGAAISDYAIEYRQIGGLAWTAFAHTASTATSITAKGLNSNSSYQFRVAAKNSASRGPWSGPGAAIAVGDYHACAVLADGTVTCWGYGFFGQLGDNLTTDSLVPVQVSNITGSTPALTAVSVSSGGQHSCAVMADGTVTCWGYNGYGQLGNKSNTSSLVPVPVWNITGSTPASIAVSVSTGEYFSCAVMADGSARCWGYNGFGQLGNNTITDSNIPVQVFGITARTPGSPAVSVSAGRNQACAVMADGAATCWGSNNTGQLGDNTTDDSFVPVLVWGLDGTDAGSSAVSVSAGDYQSCAVLADGTVTCWGDNSYGQLGNNSDISSSAPVPVSGITGLTPESTAVSVSTGMFHTCAVMATGTAACWGRDDAGQLGDNTSTDIVMPVPVPVSGIDGLTPATTADNVNVRAYQSCAVKADGTATCWGSDSNGQLGNNDIHSSPVPVQVWILDGSTPATSLRQVSSFGRTLAALPHPSRPTQLVVTGRDADSIAISWGVSISNGGKHIDLYRVSYRPKGSHSWTAFAIVPYSQLHLRVRGLRAGVTYEFQVRAHNADGLGNPSRVVSETVPMRAAAPIVVTKLRDQRAITLTWRPVRAPAHSPLIAYVMSCRAGDGDTFRTSVASSVLSASIRVPAAQSYSCRVAARTDAGRGVGSSRVQVSAFSQ